MAKQNVFGGKSKKFVFLFLSMVACVLSSLGVISASIQEATPVSADAPPATHSCIGLSFIESIGWSSYGNDPYLFIYDADMGDWADESPFSSLSDITGFDDVSYDSSEHALKVDNAVWHDNDKDVQWFTVQIPWVIKSCEYRWKRPQATNNYTDKCAAIAGNTYVDKLKGWSGDLATMDHTANPGDDEDVASSTWSGPGTTVTEYAVINGTYNSEKKIITPTDVIQNSN